MSSKKNKIEDLVIVEWIDAWSASGWHQPPDGDIIGIDVKTAGYIIQQTKEGITLAQGVGSSDAGNPRYLGVQFIPQGMIKSIKKIK